MGNSFFVAFLRSQTSFMCSEQQDKDPVRLPGVTYPRERQTPERASWVKKTVLIPAQILPLKDKILLFLNHYRLLELLMVSLCASNKNVIISFKDGNN